MYVPPSAWRNVMHDAHREPAVVDASSGGLVMRSSRAERRIAWICSTVALLGLILLASESFERPRGLLWWVPALTFVPFALGAALWLYGLRRTVLISDRGLTSRSPWAGATFIAWQEIQSVVFRKWAQSLRVRTSDERAITIPCLMSGTQDLERRMEKELPPYVCGKAFREYRAYLKRF
jgi:hypothetical protein